MKQIRDLGQFLVVLILMQAAFNGNVSAQSVENPLLVSSDAGDQESVIGLEQVLDNIEKRYSVTFLYEEQVVGGKYLNTRQMPLNQATGERLAQVLTALNLDYYQLDEETYVLVEKKEAFKSDLLLQQEIIRGTVTDAQSGETLPGVNVMVKGTTIGTSTDSDGSYELDAPSLQDTLIFSFVGYQTQEVPINDRSEIDIALQSQAIAGEELVVVGYGTQEKKNLISSVSTVEGEELTTAPLASTTNSLTGRLSGLITKQTSGLPGGDGASLSIRNFGDPLVLVDGNVVNSINNINPNAIESISVLKDASAAVYGARAGNGVILVTTKRGRSGKPKFTLNSSMSLQGPTNMLTPASSGQNAELFLEQHLNQGKPIETARFTPEEIDLFYEGTNPDYPNTDWLDAAARPWAPQTNNNLSVRGGSEDINYYVSVGYMGQESLWKNNGGGYDRYNFRSNMDAEINDNLSVKVNLSSIIENRRYPSRANEGDDSVWKDLWNTEPFYPASLPDPNKISSAAGGGIGSVLITSSRNYGYNNQDSQILNGTLSLNYDFNNIKGLSANIWGNYNQVKGNTKDFNYLVKSYQYNHSNDSYTLVNPGSSARLQHYNSTSLDLTGRFSLNYDRYFNNHHFSGEALFEVLETESDWIRAARDGFLTNEIDYLFAGDVETQTNDGRASEMGRRSLIGRVNYNYSEKYLLESSIRIDESAKFNEENRRGYFPAISLGWRISEENLIKNNISFLSNLKLRVSYAQMGNDNVGNFQYLAGYQLSDLYIFGSSVQQGLAETGIANPTLTWEEITLYNAGLDYGFFDEKLYGSIDAFYRIRDKIPGQRHNSLPSTFGASLPLENLNQINTRGFELEMGYEDQVQDFKWDISANVSWAREKWGYRDEPTEFEDKDTERLNKYTGEWTDRQFGYKSDGLFTFQDEIDNLDFVYDRNQGNASLSPGDIRYVDVNNDGLLNWRDQVNIGKGTNPNWAAGFNLNLSYKHFDLSALFQGAFGFYNNITLKQAAAVFPEIIYNERWTPENNDPNAIYPRLGGAPSNGWFSDYGLIPADYVRLKSLNIGYNLPGQLTSSLNISSTRIYLAGTNLFTLSKMNKYGLDPEAPNGNSGWYYPQMRTITAGFQISF